MYLSREKYKALLAEMESGNDYSITNAIGALGKYQFTTDTLNDLKRIYNLPNWINENYFLTHPELQEVYENALFEDSVNFIKNNNLSRYSGKVVTGRKRFKTITVPINEYGMLAAIHLSGGGNLKRFFTDGYDPDDGHTSLTDYLVFFSSKLTNIISPAIILLAFIPAIVLYYN